MTTTTHSAGPRVDTDATVKLDREAKEQEEGAVYYWIETEYPTLDRRVCTMWTQGSPDGLDFCDGYLGFDQCCGTIIYGEAAGDDDAVWDGQYDPTRVTVGGLAEAHEAVCARVERGELP